MLAAAARAARPGRPSRPQLFGPARLAPTVYGAGGGAGWVQPRWSRWPKMPARLNPLVETGCGVAVSA
jgi:hypothetical protein